MHSLKSIKFTTLLILFNILFFSPVNSQSSLDNIKQAFNIYSQSIVEKNSGNLFKSESLLEQAKILFNKSNGVPINCKIIRSSGYIFKIVDDNNIIDSFFFKFYSKFDKNITHNKITPDVIIRKFEESNGIINAKFVIIKHDGQPICFGQIFSNACCGPNVNEGCDITCKLLEINTEK